MFDFLTIFWFYLDLFNNIVNQRHKKLSAETQI